MLNIEPLPNHVAIIMDGNGRWAKEHGLPRLGGHRAGTDNIRQVIEILADYNVKYLTLYAFSTENWSRPKREVSGLIKILERVIDRETQILHEKGARICHMGTLDGLNPRLQKKVKEALEITKDNHRITVCIAFNYGGRAEIVGTVRRIVREGIPAEEITEELFNHYLSSNGIPDPDLIIRTGGEMRLSNFLLWQSAYSEYYSVPTFWPDFGRGEVEEALLAYSLRERRFGALEPRKLLNRTVKKGAVSKETS
ncbi:MAG: polyprenyl diphosphate synthase [Dehalococcoidia bacterium]|nr:polyprenyl diphosphate synthase [Dehalococcoidia bacterium]MDZ4246812.1 polyprenyl diphosphate synthase [Dehalococcoidia bacterium]